MTDKKECWYITVECDLTKKVYFDEPLTKEEAKEAYEEGEFADVYDEESDNERVVDVN